MKVLKKENWWAWLLLMLGSEGTSTFVLGALLDVYKKDAWYAKWYYWLIGVICFLFPAGIMLCVFSIQILSLVAAKLDVNGKEIYLSPYIWILGLIVPIIGWIAIFALIIYLEIGVIVRLYKGAGEKYIK